MARILIVSDNAIVQTMAATQLPTPDKGWNRVTYARSSGSMHRILEEDDHFDGIILTDMLDGNEDWRTALKRLTPKEKKLTVVFFTEFGESPAGRLTDEEIFGFAYGRSPYESPESLASQLSKLLG